MEIVMRKRIVTLYMSKKVLSKMKATKDKVMLCHLLKKPELQWPVLETVRTPLGPANVLGLGVEGCTLQILDKYCREVK